MSYDPLAPLNITLKGVDFERALIPEGTILLTVIAAEAKPNKNNDNLNIHVSSTLVNPMPTTKEGVVAQPGDRVFQTWDGVFPTPRQEEKGIDPLESISQMFDAVFQITDPNERPDLNTDTLNKMVGKQFLGIIKHEDDPQFGKQDRLVRYLPVQ